MTTYFFILIVVSLFLIILLVCLRPRFFSYWFQLLSVCQVFSSEVTCLFSQITYISFTHTLLQNCRNFWKERPLSDEEDPSRLRIFIVPESVLSPKLYVWLFRFRDWKERSGIRGPPYEISRCWSMARWSLFGYRIYCGFNEFISLNFMNKTGGKTKSTFEVISEIGLEGE